MQAQMWVQIIISVMIREGDSGMLPAAIRKIVWDTASDIEHQLTTWWKLGNFTYNGKQ